MISAYNSLVTYSGDQWEDYLYKMCLYDIFKDLIKEYPDKDDFTAIIRYIVMAYSVESDAIVIGSDWLKNKQRIFEKCDINKNSRLYVDLVHLKSKVILDTIHKWLEFCDNDLGTQLQILKDLRVEMQITCLTDIKKASGEVDFDQKFKNAQYSIDLKKMIKDLESELIQTSVKLKDSIKEYKEAKKKNSFGLETFLKDENGVGS